MPFGDDDFVLETPSLPKAFAQGTHRATSPADTVARVRPFASVMGITRIANVTGLDTVGIPVVMVCRPNSRSISVSQGKGATLDAARASGLMESVESYHAERIVAPLLLGSREELQYTHNLVDIDALPKQRPDPISPYQQLLWIEGYDLIGKCRKWVPYELVTLNYSVSTQLGFGTFVSSSNGLASGNHTIEAVNHGICEAIERDATTRWRSLDPAEQDATCVDLNTITDPMCREMLEAFRRADVMVGVWDMTSASQVPTFLCRTVQGRGAPQNTLRPASGMGCHPCREVALLRALTEAAQSRLTFISGARDDMPRKEYEYFLRADIDETWRASMESLRPCRDFRSIPTWDFPTFEEDLAWELERLVACGVTEAVAVDLTKPEFGIPVVKIIVPTLEDTTSSRRQASFEHGDAMSGITL